MALAHDDPNTQEILKRVNELLEKLPDGITVFDADQSAALIELSQHAQTLVRMAKYEEARGLVWEAKKSAILTAAAVVSAILVLWGGWEKIMEFLTWLKT